MCLLLRLLTVVSTAVLLQDSIAGVVITAPSIVTEDNAGLETREQGPTAWICSVLAVNSPWVAYANIRGYLEGGNTEGKDYSDMILYPVMEIFHANENRLCVYLPSADHCFPPAPSNNQVKAVKQLDKRNYYDMRFWGQASDARVQHYKQKLMAALDAQSKAAELNVFHVSYFSDHVREVRYDPAIAVYSSTTDGNDPAPIETKNQGSLACGTTPDDDNGSSLQHIAGVDYFAMNIVSRRLFLIDVQSSFVAREVGGSLEACAIASYNHGVNAFFFLNGKCRLFTFDEDICFCEGDNKIYINKNHHGAANEITRDTTVMEGFKKMTIYSEIEMVHRYTSELTRVRGANGDIGICEAALKSDVTAHGAFFAHDQCYLTRYQDLYSCNQTCRGIPFIAIVREENIFQNPPFLSLCGQTVFIPVKESPSIFFSHSGYGCYRYQGAKSSREADCVVTFEIETGVSLVKIYPLTLHMDRQSKCGDTVNVYNVTHPDPSSKECRDNWTGRSESQFITVVFHRRVANGTSYHSIGFRLAVTAGYNG